MQDYYKSNQPIVIETWCYDWAYQSEELINFWWWSGPGFRFRITFPRPWPLRNRGFLGDLLAFLIKSPADFYDADKRTNPLHFGSDRHTSGSGLSGSGLIQKSGFESLITFARDFGLEHVQLEYNSFLYWCDIVRLPAIKLFVYLVIFIYLFIYLFIYSFIHSFIHACILHLGFKHYV